MTKDETTSPDYVMVPRGDLLQVRLFASILLQNCEGCVRQHHKQDEIPGWLADCARGVALVDKALSAAPPSPRSDERDAQDEILAAACSALDKAHALLSVVAGVVKDGEQRMPIGVHADEGGIARYLTASFVKKCADWVEGDYEPGCTAFYNPTTSPSAISEEPSSSEAVNTMVEKLSAMSFHVLAIEATSLLIALDAERGRLREALMQARASFQAIQQATIEGMVCDDVAWFSEIETLHDYCASEIEIIDKSIARSAL
jgi:hypothetical protein